MEKNVNAKTILNEQEAAKYLGLAVQTIRNKRSGPAGGGEHLVYFKIGRSVRYRVEDLEAFLAKHRVDHKAA